jgi:hypothetical protein
MRSARVPHRPGFPTFKTVMPGHYRQRRQNVRYFRWRLFIDHATRSYHSISSIQTGAFAPERIAAIENFNTALPTSRTGAAAV